jgi:hypothetical protein
MEALKEIIGNNKLNVIEMDITEWITNRLIMIFFPNHPECM